MKTLKNLLFGTALATALTFNSYAQEIKKTKDSLEISDKEELSKMFESAAKYINEGRKQQVKEMEEERKENEKAGKLQSFENTRYSDSRISYRIAPCSQKQKAVIEKVLGLLEEKTILDFYEVKTNEKLLFKFDHISSSSEGLGGVDNGIKFEQFYMINHGVVKLKKSEECFNIFLHETLHALGFCHSTDQNNIMYPVERVVQGKCNKDTPLGEDIPKLINKLYARPIPKE